MTDKACGTCAHFKLPIWICSLKDNHFIKPHYEACHLWEKIRPSCRNCKHWNPAGSCFKIGRCDERGNTVGMSWCNQWKLRG